MTWKKVVGWSLLVIFILVVLTVVVMITIKNYSEIIAALSQMVSQSKEYALDILFIIISLVMFGVSGYFLIPIMARKNFLFVNEEMNCEKVIKKGGLPHKFIGRIATDTEGEKHVDEATGEILPGPGPKRSWLSRKFGVRFIGIPPVFKLHVYEFKWLKWSIIPNTNEYGLVKMQQFVDRIMYRAPYATRIVDAETKDRTPVSLVIQFVPELCSGMLALFNTTNWLSEIEASVSAAIRDFVASKNYNELIVLQNEIGKMEDGEYSEFVGMVMKINEVGYGNIPPIKQIGMKLNKISLLSIEIGQPRGELAEATVATYVAQQKAEAVKTTADGDAYKILAEAKAKADANDLLLKSVGGNPAHLVEIRRAEAIQGHNGPLYIGVPPVPTTQEGAPRQ